MLTLVQDKLESGTYDAIVVGAGAAGMFAAVRAKECSPRIRLLVLEASQKPLRKLSISGGGRCNVTHACHELDWLISCYPRGGPRLEAILGRFMPEDTVRWFHDRGVPLKTEADGRMFPVSDSSQTIVDCLMGAARQAGVLLHTGVRVESLKKRGKEGLFELRCETAKVLAPKILLATGGGSRAPGWLQALGHQVVPDIPSLFTFVVKHSVFEGLQGVSVPKVSLRLLTDPSHQAEGPLLVTHWGLSGPAVLKLSAFAARTLAALNYRAEFVCDFLPDLGRQEVWQVLDRGGDARVSTSSPFPSISKRLWQRLVRNADIDESTTWRRLPLADAEILYQNLKSLKLSVTGKGVFKDEFVTAGGLPLHEIDPYSMESRRVPGLHVAGELLDVDGITGGFNFQNAWASGYVAGESLGAG